MNIRPKLLFLPIILCICLFVGCSNHESKLFSNVNLNDLNVWLGEYTYSEYISPIEEEGKPITSYKSMMYDILIYEDGDTLAALISIDGHWTFIRLIADVIGNKNYIDLVYRENLPDSMGTYDKGDIILSFEMTDSELITIWQQENFPILNPTSEKKGVYFEKTEVIDPADFLTTSEITEYLHMTVKEIVEMTNAQFDMSGTMAILESYMPFSCIFPENLPIYFVCRNNDEIYTPLYISPYNDFLNACLGLFNLSKDMTFNDIIEVMGTTEISESWVANEETKAYRIDYERDTLALTFWSYNRDGLDFDIYISLVEKSLY